MKFRVVKKEYHYNDGEFEFNETRYYPQILEDEKWLYINFEDTTDGVYSLTEEGAWSLIKNVAINREMCEVTQTYIDCPK